MTASPVPPDRRSQYTASRIRSTSSSVGCRGAFLATASATAPAAMGRNRSGRTPSSRSGCLTPSAPEISRTASTAARAQSPSSKAARTARGPADG
ncbi:hypothetical protein [Streptomyces sp. NPDC001297]|uniref:hypothetical protein n=1 Tax=Streptomyces sp. NPDC001297 TaxID=3364559 RepID=UPI0036C59CB0